MLLRGGRHVERGEEALSEGSRKSHRYWLSSFLYSLKQCLPTTAGINLQKKICGVNCISLQQPFYSLWGEEQSSLTLLALPLKLNPYVQLAISVSGMDVSNFLYSNPNVVCFSVPLFYRKMTCLHESQIVSSLGVVTLTWGIMNVILPFPQNYFSSLAN